MGARPDINWEELRNWFIAGELHIATETGKIERIRPTYADVARKAGCSNQAVSARARKQRWRELRDSYEHAERERVAVAAAKMAAFSMTDALATVDHAMVAFAVQIENGQPIRNMAEFEKAIRIKAWLEDYLRRSSTTALEAPVSLADLESRHKESRRAAAAPADEEAVLAGVVSIDSAEQRESG